MKIGFLLPSLFASSTLYKQRIFAPKELAVHTINGLVDRGHEVYVFSTPDLETKGKLIAGDISYMEKHLPYYKLRNDVGTDQAIRTDEVIKRNFETSVTAQAFAFALKGGLDIIHAYHDFVFMPHYFEDVTNIPVVYTLHDPLPPENTFEYAELTKFAHHRYISISDSQRKSGLKLNYVSTVYHGIEETAFPFDPKPTDYLLFMGRLVPEKGLHSAISVARQLNIQLEIGTQFPDSDHESDYFKTKIKPFLSDGVIGEPGMVEGRDKTILYKEAIALLFPIEWEEPFGIVMVEAMACGTPVIAYNRGSVPEIVKDGITGFIVDDDSRQSGNWIIKKTGIEGLVEAVRRIGEIDRAACRRHVEENFTVEKMVGGHERAYQKVLHSV